MRNILQKDGRLNNAPVALRNLRPTVGLSHQTDGGPMKKTILAVGLAAALTSAAFAQSVGEKTGVNSALGITPKTEDFIKEAATSDMLEIEAAKIAQQRGEGDEKKSAEQMITAHPKPRKELRGLVPADLKSAVPTAL